MKITLYMNRIYRLVPQSLSKMPTSINSINSAHTEVASNLLSSTTPDSYWYQFPEVNNMMDLVSIGVSIAFIFGGIVPYIPQYLTIKRIANSEGFSTYVCLTLLIANILRILFWFGRRYKTAILLQSFVMIIGMLAMMELCVRVKNKSRSTSNDEQRQHILGDSSTHNETDPIYSVSSSPMSDNHESNADPLISPVLQIASTNSSSYNSYKYVRNFWQWKDFSSYLKFLASFTLVASVVTFTMIDNSLFVESLGFLALITESLLGMPQLLENCSKKSTRGMSVEMVVMWLSGDIFKTSYYLIGNTPAQFWICGTIQIIMDVFILFQSFYYGSSDAFHKLPKTY